MTAALFAHGPAGEPPLPVAAGATVRASSLWKRYGDVEAVRGIDLDIREGEVFGLIGPDGAGKTSAFQILAGIMEPTSGTAEIAGRASREMRSAVGYLTQSFSLYPDLTVAENIRYIGSLRRVPDDVIDERARHYLQLFDMDRFAGRLAGRLSGGMKQKLALVCALVPQPRVLLLDEPTTGVDPVSRREFWNALTRLAANGLTLVVATPYLDEAERCDRVALMHLGEILEVGTPAAIRGSLDASRLELTTSALAEAEQLLLDRGDGEIIDTQRFGDRLDVLVKDAGRSARRITDEMAAHGLSVAIHAGEPTLENVFVATLRGLGHDVAAAPFPARRAPNEHRNQIAIGASHLTKQFDGFTAVKDVSLEVRYGEIYGLLGANGAGKTTTIKMLCGLVAPTGGEIELAGRRGSIRLRSTRQRIGYMSQRFTLYDDLTIEENLDFFAGVYGVADEERDEKVQWVLDFAGMRSRRGQMTGSLPGGWKQRVAFGAAIMHEPSVLFLDEPTSGVDPLARRALWRMINRLADAGTAILVTTHYLEEAEQCNRLGFMAAGELVAEGTPGGIRSRQSGHLLEVLADDPRRAAEILERDGQRVSVFGARLHVVTDEIPEAAIHSIDERLRSGHARLLSAREVPLSLEDVFIDIVERAKGHIQ